MNKIELHAWGGYAVQIVLLAVYGFIGLILVFADWIKQLFVKPTTLVKLDWRKLWNAESKEGNFEFIHASDSKRIQLCKVDADGRPIAHINLNYEQWQELCRFINQLSDDKPTDQ